MNEPEPESIDISQLQPGPIRHESLSPELLDHVRAVFDVIGPYIGMTLEQFEVNLMRDVHPENEVAVWCGITAAWIAYHEEYLDDKYLADDEENKLIGALIVISTGSRDLEKLNVPDDVGRKLLECYDELGKE